MNILEEARKMERVQNMTKDTLKNYLDKGYHVLVADYNNFKDIVLKYDLFVVDGIMLATKVSNSTRDRIILTPESAAIYNDTYIDMLWDSYLSARDIFCIDKLGVLKKAPIEPSIDIRSLKRQISDTDIISFNDVYSPMENFKKHDLNIYVVDGDSIGFGKKSLDSSLSQIGFSNIVDSQDKADFTIIIMPLAMKAPAKDFYSWLTPEYALVPEVTTLLKKLDSHDNILIYWTSNVAMNGMIDQNQTAYKALFDLSTYAEYIRDQKQ